MSDGLSGAASTLMTTSSGPGSDTGTMSRNSSSTGAAYCWQQLEAGGLPGDAHALKEVLVFLEHVPDRPRADQHAAALASNLAGIPLFHLDPDAPGYGLSPLDVAPQATSRWRALFTDAQIGAHLDRAQKDQQADGGWPITWEPPSQAAVSEWRRGRDPGSPAHAHVLRTAHRGHLRRCRAASAPAAPGRDGPGIPGDRRPGQAFP
jgi:hypothetical protein